METHPLRRSKLVGRVKQLGRRSRGAHVEALAGLVVAKCTLPGLGFLVDLLATAGDLVQASAGAALAGEERVDFHTPGGCLLVLEVHVEGAVLRLAEVDPVVALLAVLLERVAEA